MTPLKLTLPKTPKMPKMPKMAPATPTTLGPVEDVDLFDFDVDVPAMPKKSAPPPTPRPTVKLKLKRGRPKGVKARPTVPKVLRPTKINDGRQGTTSTTGISLPLEVMALAKERAFARGQTFSHYLATLVKADLGIDDDAT